MGCPCHRTTLYSGVVGGKERRGWYHVIERDDVLGPYDFIRAGDQCGVVVIDHLPWMSVCVCGRARACVFARADLEAVYPRRDACAVPDLPPERLVVHLRKAVLRV
jgi:hypothetical protein